MVLRSALLALLAALPLAPLGDPLADGLGTILEEDVRAHLWQLASPELEGRDYPSAGLEQAARYLARLFEEAGAEPFEGGFLRAFQRTLPRPVEAECSLELEAEGEREVFEFGLDFVPLAGCPGNARGEIVFLGFGMEVPKERFHEIKGKGLEGKVALILEGEPRHPRKFDGPEAIREASIWTKLENLREAGLAAVLVARRPPPAPEGRRGIEVEPAALGFRHTWATWATERMAVGPEGMRGAPPPALEVSIEAASRLLGEDVAELAAKIDRSGKPLRREPVGRVVALSSKTDEGPVEIPNVVGLLRGTDPLLAGEHVVIGAHYDHVGVDELGRIGFGADDNASGTAALIELVQALAVARPRRSVIACAFAAEEDGLLGSKAFCDRPPVPLESIVAMVNMDMLGRGDADEVAVLGIRQNPTLEDVLDRARRLERTGVKSVVVRKGEELFARSDHYPFHQKGIPALFFFEGLPISRNADYHTWRDDVAGVDPDKVARSAKLVFNTVWILASDDERPPSPRR